MRLWKRITGQALKAEAEAQRQAAERAAEALKTRRPVSPSGKGRGKG
ncbi:MAG: hypothetical protein ACU0BS_02085 [Hasllibacter sp.]